MDNSRTGTVLDAIVAKRRTHLDGIRARLEGVDFDALPRSERSLYESLKGGNRFIMECKSASPSLGLIREHYEPGAIARIYSRYAAGISVLCEPERFGGDYDHLATVAMSTHLPVLCKDFIIDPIQVYAARYFGADAILLMMSIVTDEEYAELKALADKLGLDVLTEAITREEVDRAVAFGVDIIGINNRNLHDLSIDLDRTEQLGHYIPEGKIVVSESGIRNNATVRHLGAHAGAFLVGSQLTGEPDVDRAARELVYGTNKVCGLTSASAAQAARAAGAIYGGLIFEPASPRSVSRETATSIMAAEPDLEYVAVTRQTDDFDFPEGISAIQLHAPYQGDLGEELALIARARQTGLPIWRAISMTEDGGPELALALAEHVDLLVLDSGSGGTGTTFDWSTIPQVIKDKALLAGGLSLENLTDALGVGMKGLDLNSGLERAGRKDAGLIARAFATIRAYTD